MKAKPSQIAAASLLAVACAWAQAQAPVVELGGERPNSSSRNTAPPAGGNNEVVVNLYFQLEALQREVQDLRGIVEEQGYLIQRMQTEARDRYLDLDRRLSGLTGGATAPLPSAPAAGAEPAAPLAGAANPPTEPPASPLQNPAQVGAPGGLSLPPSAAAATPPQPAAPAAPQGEQETYRTALNLLLEQGDYQQAITLFQQYIDNYPQGGFITNAYYWQGEALLLVSRHAEARDAFLKVLSDFPSDPKAPGALLKLGVAYERLGNQRQARETWRSIATQYPDSLSEIRVAEEYLSGARN